MRLFLYILALAIFASPARAQFGLETGAIATSAPNVAPWTGILKPVSSSNLTPAGTYAGLGIDWSQAGIPGGIPSASWTQCGSTITSTGSDQSTQIQTALNSCASNQFVLLAAGTFQIAGSNITVPSLTALRGMGADQTILNLTGSGTSVIALGSATAFPNAANACSVVSGATAGTTSIVVSGGCSAASGQLMVIGELNLWPYVTGSGGPGGGNCTGGQCELVFGWGPLNGVTRSRGQTVIITGVTGNTITFSPALYTDYLHALPNWTATTVWGYAAYISDGGHFYLNINNNASPYTCTSGASKPTFPINGTAVSDGSGASTCLWQDEGTGTTTQPQIIAYNASAQYAGVENLQFFFNNTGYGQAVAMSATAYSWVSGVETNYLDGDISDVSNGFRDQFFENYFSNSFSHTPGSHDACINLKSGTSGVLVQNSIFERLHTSVILEAGASGNVIHANFMQTNFDTGGLNAVFAGVDLHGAQPQFNLIEANVLPTVANDSTWGGNWQGTSFRNWVQGTGLLCDPMTAARGTVTCTPSGFPGQGGVNSWYQFQASRGESFDFASLYFNAIADILGSSAQQALVNTSNNPLTQQYRINWSASRSYDGTAYGVSAGYSGAADSGSFQSDSTAAAISLLIHGVYSNLPPTGTIYQAGLTTVFPPSFFLPAKPSWWGSLPYPSIGPDVTGGTGPGGHVSSTTAANPAMNCYFNIMGGSVGGSESPLTFNRGACYP